MKVWFARLRCLASGDVGGIGGDTSRGVVILYGRYHVGLSKSVICEYGGIDE